MLDKEKFISALQDNFGETFNNAKLFSGEIKDLIRSSALNTLDNLDIVSREEFDAQKAVLNRAEQKLEQLQDQIKELKETIKNICGEEPRTETLNPRECARCRSYREPNFEFINHGPIY